MSGDSGKEQSDKNVLHLDGAERLPRAPACNAERSTAGRSHGLPVISNTSPAAEVVKQIIEQILANERRRARIEFVRLSVIFLVFLLVILGAGIWFARQLLAQLREERQLTEQSWRMAAGQVDGARAPYPAGKQISGQNSAPILNRATVAKLEQNLRTVSDLLNAKPQDSSASVRDMLQNQESAIQALNTQLNGAQDKIAGAEADKNTAPEEAKQIDFIAAPVAGGLKLRMPIPSL